MDIINLRTMALHNGITDMDTDTGIHLQQGSQSAPVSPSSSTCSSIYAPSLDPRDSNCSFEHRTPPPTVSITNFCIDEILKPDFGRNLFNKSSVHESAFVPWNIAASSATNISKQQQDLRSLYEQRLGALRLQYDLSVRTQRPMPLAPHSWPGGSRKLNTTKDKYKHSSPRRKILDAVPDRRSPSPQRDPDDPEASRVEAPRGGPKSPSVAEDRDFRHSNKSSGTCDGKSDAKSDRANERNQDGQLLWPAWVYCTRYSDRPSSGPRSRKVSRSNSRKADDKRPRTAFSNEQLQKLKTEFELNRYLTEERRHKLAAQLELNESQIKIWFQNKRAKIKKSTTLRNGLALHLMEQGLYNHSTVPLAENGEA